MLAPGVILQNRYTILHELGGGGMSRVYLAQDARLGTRLCAVKELRVDPGTPPAEVPQMEALFQQEAILLAELQHPNLPAVWDFFAEADSLFLVMQYIEGEPLDQVLARSPDGLPEKVVLAYAEQICAALELLHGQPQPIIFRDLKPSNIMLARDGTIKLIDFGIARLFKPASHTDTLRMGTLGYAPPEQYKGGGQTDARSDIYALGATLHHLLTGRDPTREPPFSFPPVRAVTPAVSQATEAAVMRALAYDRGQRWDSVAEMRAALAGRAAAPRPTVQVTSSSAGQTAPYLASPISHPISRRPLPSWVLGMAAVLLIVIAVSVGASLSTTQETPVASAPRPMISPTDAPTVMPKSLLPTNTSTQTETVTVAPEVTVQIVTAPPSLTASPTPTQPPSATPTSPPLDEGLIAYGVPSGEVWSILLIAPDGTGRRFLPGAPYNSLVPSFSPVGETLTFRSKVGDTWQIFTMQLDGTDLRQITTPPGSNYEANWSPDGQQFAFLSDRDGNRELYVMQLDGSSQRRLTYSPGWDDDPTWSPDGQWIAFESYRDARTDIYKVRPDGSDLTRLTWQQDGNYTPAWSPDGRWIAFESKSNGQEHIWLMRPDGSGLRPLTSTGKIDQRAAWSPDGTRIALTSDRTGEFEIWIMNIDGSAPYQLTTEGGAYDAAWSRW